MSAAATRPTAPATAAGARSEPAGELEDEDEGAALEAEPEEGLLDSELDLASLDLGALDEAESDELGPEEAEEDEAPPPPLPLPLPEHCELLATAAVAPDWAVAPVESVSWNSSFWFVSEALGW